MAKQYKKLQNKVYPKKNAVARPKEKIGRDYLLMAVIAFTTVVTIFGWTQFDLLNRSMYVLLTFSLCMTYIFRHANISDNAKIYVNRASLAAMGLAVALFLLSAYHTFTG